MNAASHLENNAGHTEFVSIADLKKVTDSMFPEDGDLPFWIMGRILLRDIVYFQLRYPGQDIKGCQYKLEVRHVSTGQTREEWVKDLEGSVYDVDDLSNPHLWLIGAESLSRQYCKLFVYVPDWRCQDATDHSKWVSIMPRDYAEIRIDRLVSDGRRDVWEEQVRVQEVNPCVYAIIEWWILSDPRLHF